MLDRRLLALEVATVVMIAGLALWSVRPLVEEWGTLTAFNQLGAFYPWQGMLSQMALRPLHMVGYLLQWILGGGTPIGAAITALLVMVARYAIVRWAVTPFLAPEERWVVATFGAVLFAWPAAWLARYLGAQISSVLFFVALGLSLRLARRTSAAALILGSLAAFAALLFYQALALAMVLASALCVVASLRVDASDHRYSRAMFAGAPFFIALSAYAVYAVVISAFGVPTYETGMVGESLGPTLIALRLIAIYSSAFGGNPLTAPLLVSVAIGFLLFASSGSHAIVRSGHFLLVVVAVLSLPVLALTYLYIGHASDLERTLLPISVGFVGALIVIGVATRQEAARARRIAPAAALVTVALLVSLGFAHQARFYWNIQSAVIDQMLKKPFRGEKGVLLKDTTGVLGGVYTFHVARAPDGTSRTNLQQALRAYGLDTNVAICTPLRINRVAWRQSLPKTERCEDEQYFPPHDKVLIAKWGPNGILIALEPSRRVHLGTPVRFDESGAGDALIVDGWSGQEKDFRWSEGPTASLVVELDKAGGAAAELVLTLEPFLGGGLAAQGVGVEINGVNVGAWQVDRRSDYTVAIPPEVIGDGRLAIVLAISDPTEPCKVMQSSDCRPLGVAIRKLVVN